MAKGSKWFEINWENAVAGASTAADLPDGGFSPETDAVNLLAEQGVIHQPAQPTDKSTNLTGDIIASCEDPAGSAARLYVSTDGDQDGRFYSADGDGDLTARGSEDTGANYIPGRTDMAPFGGEVYVTNSAYAVRWQQPATFNLTFLTFNDSNAPHPVLKYENNFYYGDGNEVHRQTAAGSAPNPASPILTLDSGYVITAFGIDPGSGYMLIATVDQYNVSDTQSTQARVHFWDGQSNKVLRTVLVDDMITAFPTTEGELYTATGMNLGTWNGAGITFLRDFRLDLDNTELLYKHHFAGIGPTLYLVAKTRIWAHGPIQQGGAKVFYPAYKNQVNSNDITNIAYLGAAGTSTGRFLSIAFSDAKYYTWNTLSVATSNTQDFYSNEYEAPDEYWVRRIRVIWKNSVSNGVDPGSLRLIGDEGTITSVGSSGLIDLANNSGAASKRKDITFDNCKVTQLQLRFTIDTVVPGIRRVIVYADPANLPAK